MFRDSCGNMLRVVLQTGSSQGDVFGGVLFAAAHSEALVAAQQKHGVHGLNMFSYFDDTCAHLPT